MKLFTYIKLLHVYNSKTKPVLVYYTTRDGVTINFRLSWVLTYGYLILSYFTTCLLYYLIPPEFLYYVIVRFLLVTTVIYGCLFYHFIINGEKEFNAISRVKGVYTDLRIKMCASGI